MKGKRLVLATVLASVLATPLEKIHGKKIEGEIQQLMLVLMLILMVSSPMLHPDDYGVWSLAGHGQKQTDHEAHAQFYAGAIHTPSLPHL